MLERLYPDRGGTTPQELAVQDVRRCINFCRQMELPVLGVVENMSGFTCPKCGERVSIFEGGYGQLNPQIPQSQGFRCIGVTHESPHGMTPLEESSGHGSPLVSGSADDEYVLLGHESFSFGTNRAARAVQPLFVIQCPNSSARIEIGLLPCEQQSSIERPREVLHDEIDQDSHRGCEQFAALVGHVQSHRRRLRTGKQRDDGPPL